MQSSYPILKFDTSCIRIIANSDVTTFDVQDDRIDTINTCLIQIKKNYMDLYGPGVTYIQGNGRLVNALSRDAAIQACRINDAMIDHSLHINPNAQFEKGSAVM